MTLDKLIELHETRYLRLLTNPSSIDELEMCQQALTRLRELRRIRQNTVDTRPSIIEKIAIDKELTEVLRQICGELKGIKEILTNSKIEKPSEEMSE